MLSIEERRAKWVVLLADQQSSGLTVTAWCREHGIEKNTFYGWRHRLAKAVLPTGRKVKSSNCKRSPEWLSISMDPAPVPSLSSAGLTLRVGVVSVDVAPGFDAALLQDVLSVLEARC